MRINRNTQFARKQSEAAGRAMPAAATRLGLLIKANFNPEQPREPRGRPDGGRWTRTRPRYILVNRTSSTAIGEPNRTVQQLYVPAGFIIANLAERIRRPHCGWWRVRDPMDAEEFAEIADPFLDLIGDASRRRRSSNWNGPIILRTMPVATSSNSRTGCLPVNWTGNASCCRRPTGSRNGSGVPFWIASTYGTRCAKTAPQSPWKGKGGLPLDSETGSAGPTRL